MVKLSKSIFIHAPAEKNFSDLDDPNNLAGDG
jgi:hypothetical protein